MQKLEISLPPTSPELMCGVEIYEKGSFKSDGTLYINAVRVMVGGTLSGAQILEVGHNGVLHLT